MAEQRGWPYERVDLAPPAPPPAVPQAVGFEPPPFVEPVAPVASRAAAVAAVVAAAVAIVLTSVGLTDWWVRNRELDVLLDAVERSEAAQRPYLAVAILTQDTCLRRAACDLEAPSRAAETALAELSRAGEQVAATKVARTHGAIRTLRDTYLAHNHAWQAFLTDVTDDPVQFNAPSQAISDTWAAVHAKARAAVPPLALNNAGARLDRILR